MDDEITYTPHCVVLDCEQPATCCDFKNYTQQRGALPTELEESLNPDIVDDPQRQVWYCSEHAVTHLFYIIDSEVGNTMDAIVGDFKEAELF